MKRSKIKTDKSDSKFIGESAVQVDLKLWEGNFKNEIEGLQIARALSVYAKHNAEKQITW